MLRARLNHSPELRRLAAAKLAQEKPGQTLQATALVHEAYLRLVNQTAPPQWDNQRHFFTAAAEAMRRILIERARQRQSLKRGGDQQRVELADAPARYAECGLGLTEFGNLAERGWRLVHGNAAFLPHPVQSNYADEGDCLPFPRRGITMNPRGRKYRSAGDRPMRQRPLRPTVLLLILLARSMPTHAQNKLVGLPTFHHRGVALDYKDLKYNPCDDIIIPSVVRTDRLQKLLGRYYMYYAPHNAPGGICLAYSDTPEGPWKEYEANPLITRQWAPHHKVSHVSGPHAIWIKGEKRLFLYYHGENDVTRFASTTDGIRFEYEGVAVTTKMFDAITEASYARVFRYTIPGKDNHYIMLLMGNNRGTRRIYLAWSKDGRSWEARRTALLDPPPGTGQVAQAWYFPWRGKHYLIYHGHLASNMQIANLYANEIDPTFENPTYLGLFHGHTTASPDNVAQMSPCF